MSTQTTQDLKEFKSLFAQITSLFTEGVKKWVQAGEIIMDLIDTHGLTPESISQGMDRKMSEEIVIRLEQLGRKKIIPELLILSCPAQSYGFHLPYKKQEKLIVKEEAIEVVMMDPSGSSYTLNVLFSNLTAFQCRQVFSKGVIRDLAAQRAWLESEKTKVQVKTVPRAVSTYDIIGNSVVVNQPCRFTKRDLLRMLKELK